MFILNDHYGNVTSFTVIRLVGGSEARPSPDMDLPKGPRRRSAQYRFESRYKVYNGYCS